MSQYLNPIVLRYSYDVQSMAEHRNKHRKVNITLISSSVEADFVF